MIVLVVVTFVLVLAAGASAVLAYGPLGSKAWNDQWNEGGMGLASELVFLLLVVGVGIAMSVVLSDSFEKLFLDGGWRSGWYIGVLIVCGLGVAFYIRWAYRSLALKQPDRTRVHRECRVPYLAYAPYSLIVLVGLVVPVLAMVVVSVGSDYRSLSAARRDLDRNGASVSLVAEAKPDVAEAHVALYTLEYQAAVDTVQRTVGRYLWVVGLFVFFLIVIANTQITRAYSEAAQDLFKVMMWLLLLGALIVCLLGLWQHREMRESAVATLERVGATADGRDQLSLAVYVRQELLDLREEGPARVLRGGFVALLSLVVFTNAFQFLIAKFTHRSAVDVIFPRSVARFVHRFLLVGEREAGASP